MSVYRYKYSLLPGLERTGILAPIIPVTFENDRYNFSTFALVDSGGEMALISTAIADALCLKWKNYPKKTGYGTAGGFIFHTVPNVTAQIEDFKFILSLNVVEGIYAFKCILGRRDLFKQAKITFEGYKNEFSAQFRNIN